MTGYEKTNLTHKLIEDFSNRGPERHVPAQHNEQSLEALFSVRPYCWKDTSAGIVEVQNTGDKVVMHFCLSGQCSYKTKGGNKLISFKESTYNFLHLSSGEYKLMASSLPFKGLIISVDKGFFLKQLPFGHPFVGKIDSACFEKISPKNLMITPRIQEVLRELQSCAFEGHLKRLYTKAKVIELITLQMFQYEAEQDFSSSLKQEEIEKMMYVKKLIDANQTEPYSLACLAKAAGTNEQYLKKHFKAIYGQTVFGYVLSRKMNRAKEMLLSGEHRVADIAVQIGYKHATHFTSAFKKFFGYLPQKLKPKSLMGGMLLFSEEVEVMYEACYLIVL